MTRAKQDEVAFLATGVAPQVPSAELVGTTIDRYHVVARLGAGGMGEVYRAHDIALDRQVALKVLPPLDAEHHASFEARLRREAQALAKLDHANVVRVYDVGVAERSVFVAMQLVEGTTLSEYLRAAPRSAREILPLFVAAGRGIAAAHDGGIIHRDIKPSNILVQHTGGVFVSDFGLARGAGEIDLTSASLRDAARPGKAGACEPTASMRQNLVDARMTQTGHLLGTPVYMSPEQHAGEPATASSDQYSFCVSLWEALYREHPFGGPEWTTAALPRMALDEVRDPPRGSHVPARVERALRRGLRHDPAARWPTMTALVDEIAPRSRAAWLWGGFALVMAAVGMLVTAWLMKSEEPVAACDAEVDKVQAVWPARRPEVSALGPGAHLYLDGYATQLAAMRVAACEASHARDSATPVLHDNELRCLDDDLRAMSGLIDYLAAGGKAVADTADYLAAQLPMLDDCSAGAQQMLAPLSASDAGRASDIRLALSRARVIAAIGNGKKARPIADAALADARALGYAPVLADALLARAELLAARLDPAAGATAREAAELAASAHADRIAASADTLALAIAADADDLAQIDVLLPIARAAATRVGTPDTLAAYDRAASAAARAQARYLDAEALCTDAVGQVERVSADSWEAGKLRDAVIDHAYGCFAQLAIARGAYRTAMPYVTKWLDHRKQALDKARPLAGVDAERFKLELDYHAGQYAKAIDGIRYQKAGVEVATGEDKGLATFDDTATIVRMYRDQGMRSGAVFAMKGTVYSARSGAVVAARDALALADAHPLDVRRARVAEQIRGDLAGLLDDRAGMYKHYAAALDLAEHTLRPDDDRLAELRYRIALAYAADGDLPKAEDHLAKAQATWQRTTSPHLADALAARASFLIDQGDCTAALPLLDRAIRAPIEDRFDRARAKFDQASCIADRTKARAALEKLGADAAAYSPDIANRCTDWLATRAPSPDYDVQWAITVRASSSEFGTDKWSAAQALGAPNVYPLTGDFWRAWASKEAEAPTEYLELGFVPTRTRGIRIYETFNPGAIASVELITASGARSKLATDAIPSPTSTDARVVVLDTPCTSEPIVAVRITLVSSRVRGWNELDAVGLAPCR